MIYSCYTFTSLGTTLLTYVTSVQWVISDVGPYFFSDSDNTVWCMQWSYWGGFAVVFFCGWPANFQGAMSYPLLLEFLLLAQLRHSELLGDHKYALTQSTGPYDKLHCFGWQNLGCSRHAAMSVPCFSHLHRWLKGTVFPSNREHWFLDSIDIIIFQNASIFWCHTTSHSRTNVREALYLGINQTIKLKTHRTMSNKWWNAIKGYPNIGSRMLWKPMILLYWRSCKI
jgi:hypothetical protein